MIHAHKDSINKIIQYADFVFCNEDEAKVYAEVMEFTYTDLMEVAEYIAMKPKIHRSSTPRTVVITQGSMPVLVAVADQNENGGKVIKSLSQAVPSIETDKIVDTNGAGDAFTGGFLSAIIMGKSIKEAIHAGNWMAGQIIQRTGCSFPQ